MAIATNDAILMAPFLPVYRRMGAMGIPNGLHPVGMGPDGGHQGLRRGLRRGSDGVGSGRSTRSGVGSPQMRAQMGWMGSRMEWMDGHRYQ